MAYEISSQQNSVYQAIIAVPEGWNPEPQEQEAPSQPKVLYFEGAGWSGADISRATVGNCRIRTAFHLDDGRPAYLEITACERRIGKSAYYEGWVDSCHYITGSSKDCNRSRIKVTRDHFEYTHAEILRLVNSIGCSFDAVGVLPDLGGYRVFKGRAGYGVTDYNFGDEFQPDRELIAAREAVDTYLQERERQITGRKYPAYSLWVDEADPAILHFNSNCGRKFDLCLAVPQNVESLPVLEKVNAVPGCFYAFCGGWQQLHRIYRITEVYAAENDLMHLDRCETSVGNFALPGSDIYRKEAR